MNNQLRYSILLGCFLNLVTGSSCSRDKDDSEPGMFAFSFSGGTFSVHDGHTLFAQVIDRNAGSVWSASAVVKNGAFAFTKAGVLKEGSSYFLDYYIDMNANGACDTPPTDHSWRVKINDVAAAVDVVDVHHFDFVNVCDAFSGASSATGNTVTLTVSGRLLLADSVSGSTQIAPGDPVPQATVFLEGFPKFETTSNRDGAFTLQIPVPTDSLALLTASDLNAVMWYTETSPGKSPFFWDTTALRFGARKSFAAPNLGAPQSDLGTVQLTYTKRVKLTLVDAQNVGVSECWLSVPKYAFQLLTKFQGEGVFTIDYLPAGDYALKAVCRGFADKHLDFNVDAAAGLNEAKDLGTFILSPL